MYVPPQHFSSVKYIRETAGQGTLIDADTALVCALALDEGIVLSRTLGNMLV